MDEALPAAQNTGGDAVALTGTVERITFYNPENGFTVARVRTRGRREPLAVVGVLPAAQPGERLVMTGRWRTDPQHGAQFRPETAEVQPPDELDDIARYLGSGLIRQLGPVLASRIVATFGASTLSVLDETPARVREVPGIGRQRAAALAAAWTAHRALRAVSAFLAEHGIDRRFAPRLVTAYGADAPRILAANPYRLVADVPGLGFTAAERLGKDLGVRPSSPVRLQAAVHATLLRASEQGHTRLQADTLRDRAATLAGVGSELVEMAITQLLTAEVITRGSRTPSVDGQQTRAQPGESRLSPSARIREGWIRIYEPEAGTGGRATHSATPDEALRDQRSVGLAGLVRAEEALAAAITQLAARRWPDLAPATDMWLAADPGAGALSAEQRAAVREAILSGCFILTGGPGVGKTTTLRVLVRCLQSVGRTIALAAPTGKAAKRLGDVVGEAATTVHRLLGAGPSGFRHRASDPLPMDAVIVDEASMLDTQLARAVTTAVGPQAQLILVGDADQLPSVGPGQVLRDLLASDTVPHARLETVFRQASQSLIVRNAHRIRRGDVPMLLPSAALTRGIDCVFVPERGDSVAGEAARWAARELPRLIGLAPDDVQVLAPLTRVCQAVNALLQARLNPARGQAERPFGALVLRTGDRVIQTRNSYQLGVFNGDTGVVSAIDGDEVTVDFGDGRIVAYASADLLDLDHSYCLTVHRAQGSEWPGVVVIASSSHGPMLSRNLLYTALTRAKRAAVLVGDEAGITRAVAETRDMNRSTGLVPLLTPSSISAAPPPLPP